MNRFLGSVLGIRWVAGIPQRERYYPGPIPNYQTVERPTLPGLRTPHQTYITDIATRREGVTASITHVFIRTG
jgi:hypothetical protein